MLFNLLLIAGAVLLGPPTLRITAANPATAQVKGAVLMVNAAHHGETSGFTLTARAEGMVNGKRVTQPVTITRAGTPGLYGIPKQWDSGSPWVIVVTIHESEHNDTLGVIDAAVRIARDGRVVGTDYPMQTLKSSSGTSYVWPRRVRPAEIDSALTALAKQ